MEPRDFLRLLCRRYDVPFTRARGLEPLLRRARELDPDARRRLLRHVESRLERLAREAREQRKLDRALDERCLRSVAQLLHDWKLLPEERGR